jgi:hypothetical protein
LWYTKQHYKEIGELFPFEAFFKIALRCALFSFMVGIVQLWVSISLPGGQQ